MQNQISTNTNGVELRAILKVKGSFAGVFSVGVLSLMMIVGLVSLVTFSDSKHAVQLMIPVLILSTITVLLPIRYLLWNLFGEEHLIVTSKAIAYFHDYGIIQTNLKTIKFSRLATSYERVKIHDKKELGKLVFFDYPEDDLMSEVIHETTVWIEKEKLIKLETEIQNLFYQDLVFDNNFVPFSQN